MQNENSLIVSVNPSECATGKVATLGAPIAACYSVLTAFSKCIHRSQFVQVAYLLGFLYELTAARLS